MQLPLKPANSKSPIPNRTSASLELYGKQGFVFSFLWLALVGSKKNIPTAKDYLGNNPTYWDYTDN
jgi:hypothetical protein